MGNGVGLEFNHLFGFGVLDAGAMVALAKPWKSVPARFHCEAGSAFGPARIPMDKSLCWKRNRGKLPGTCTSSSNLKLNTSRGSANFYTITNGHSIYDPIRKTK